MAKQTGSIDLKAQKAAHDAAAAKATSYIFKTTGHDAWVCDEDAGPNPTTGEAYGPSATKPTTGWRIGSVFEMVRAGISYMKLWVDSNLVTKLRLGDEQGGHAVFGSGGMEVFDWDADADSGNGAAVSVAEFGKDGARVGNEASGNYIEIDSDSIDIIHAETSDGTTMTEVAHFGYGPGNAASGTAEAPYYTLGTRAEDSEVGNYSVAEGEDVTASGYCSHAEGSETFATDIDSHAEGSGSYSSGYASHAEGSDTIATDIAAHAEGEVTEANGEASHAEGFSTEANGDYSHAEGGYSQANGDYSHAGGYATTAGYDYQTVIGRDNDNKSTNLFEIGNGTSNAPSNAFEVDASGNVNIPSGAKYKINGTNLAASNVGAATSGHTHSYLSSASTLFQVTSESATSSSISSGSAGEKSVTVSKSGYYPLGVVGFSVSQAAFVMRRCYLSARSSGSATVYWNVRNVGTGAATADLSAHVLWVKTSA